MTEFSGGKKTGRGPRCQDLTLLPASDAGSALIHL